MQTNEIFLLVGEVVARMVAAFSTNGDIAAARSPFADFVQEPWWEVAVSRDITDESCRDSGEKPSCATRNARSDVGLPETLRSLCEESVSLLGGGLGSQRQLDDIVSAERFGRIIGMFEQNNVGIRASSPIPKVLRELQSNDVDDERTELVKDVTALISELEKQEDCSDGEEESSDDGDDNSVCKYESKVDQDAVQSQIMGPRHDMHDLQSCCQQAHEDSGQNTSPGGVGHSPDVLKDPDYESADECGILAMFPPLDGTALYTLICCMNHSCRPNCVVKYPGRRNVQRADGKADPLVAEIVLLEDVQEGDELTQSYVDKDMDLEERRRALEDYGFLCRCPRCLSEEEKVCG